MATSLASLLTGRPCRPETAMTGEITLRGKVMAVGGIKEKVLAARRAGIRTIIMPAENEKDLQDVPQDARADLAFRFARTIDDVFEHALEPAAATTESGGRKPARKRAARPADAERRRRDRVAASAGH
jgi:ATP-dependent Lon protease